ncbi:MAG: hypothetical protein IJE88_04195 [Akkermansia sp.]|nr:hypothetical protein [Akkermansia sp.]
MQPLYRPSQYRNTAVHQPGRAPQVNLPTPDFSAPAEASAAMVDHADGLQKTLADDIEYTSSLAEENRIFELTTNALAEYTRRSNLPDGVDGSWYDERGLFRENEYKEWESSILSQLNTSSAAGFIRPESKQRAVAASLDARNKLRTQLTARQAADIPAHARRRLETSIRHHLDRGDYLGATAILSTAPDRVINPEDRAALQHSINMGDMLSQFSTAAASGNPADFLKLYSDKQLLAKADPATLAKINQLIPRISPSSGTASLTRSKDGTVTYHSDFPNLPFGVPDYIYDPYIHSGGQPAFKADPALRMAAYKNLTRFAAESVTPHKTETVERFKQVANLYGFDEGAANDILAPIVERYTKANTYNPKETSAKLLTWRNYATPSQQAEVKAYDLAIANLSAQFADLPLDADEDDRKKILENLATTRANLESVAQEIRHRENEAETLALAAYDTWAASNQQATKAERITKFYDLADQYTASPFKDLLPYQYEIQSVKDTDDALARIRQDYGAEADPSQYQQNITATDQRRATTQETAFSMECSSEMTTLPETNEQPILYLPADSADTRTTITVRNGKTTIPAKIVKTDKVATAVLSNHLQLQLGILGSSGYNSILFNNGEASLTHTLQADSFSDSIFDLEARRDKNGNLTVYTPPKADGGGAYEVAGINAKYHPAKAARLKHLIESGNPEQAEKEAKQYYIHYTQPAGDTLTIQGVNSPAAELMLRDIYFNMGPGGMQRVLYRAFGNQPISTYLRTHNEQDLIQRIYTARAGYYEAIIRSNPSKKIFRNGWLNRNNKILASAAALIK